MSTDSILDGEVTHTVAAGVATVTFGHPKGNSLPGSVLGRLADTIEAAALDSATRVIVLASTGSGPFCAGASFDELRAVEDRESGQRFFTGFARVILAMIRAPQLVIVRVQGKAAGGGVGLIAAGDYAIGSTAAAVKLSELAVGIGPFVVGPVIERRIGTGHFAAMAIDADWRSAEWARDRGLLSQLCDSTGALDEAVAVRARWIAEANPAAVRELKRVFWSGTESWEVLLRERAGVSGSLVLTDAAREAIERAGRRA